jgi:hypothetical protein
VSQGQIVQPVGPTLFQPGHDGKGKSKSSVKIKKWQIKLDGQWKDYDNQEDAILKRAYLVGQPNARFHLRGNDYEYNFRKMIQINKKTRKEREIRPPPGFRPPKQELLPTGPMTIITVGTGQPGSMITVNDPNNPGQKIDVFVPPTAKAGQKMAVPIPGKGETVQSVQAKQKKHDEEKAEKAKAGGWSTGSKVAAGGAALVGIGAVGVGGVILGDHLAGGDLAADMGDGIVDAGEAVGGAVADAGEAIADWAPDAVEDAADWLGDAGGDIGEFIMDFF